MGTTSALRLIGLTGKARSGKDTFAGYLSYVLKIPPYALASPIKRNVNQMFGWDDRHSDGELKEVIDETLGFSPRKAYQVFGTEFGRHLNPDIWINMARAQYRMIGKLIITDVRFDNEAKWIQSEGGIVIEVVRDSIKAVEGHSSETGVNREYIDYTIENNGSLNDLMYKAPALVMDVYNRRLQE